MIRWELTRDDAEFVHTLLESSVQPEAAEIADALAVALGIDTAENISLRRKVLNREPILCR